MFQLFAAFAGLWAAGKIENTTIKYHHKRGDRWLYQNGYNPALQSQLERDLMFDEEARIAAGKKYLGFDITDETSRGFINGCNNGRRLVQFILEKQGYRHLDPGYYPVGYRLALGEKIRPQMVQLLLETEAKIERKRQTYFNADKHNLD